MKVAIVGVGNILLQDEGVGVHAIEKLRERFDFPEDVAIIDGGTMGLDLLPFIENTDKLLLVDAIDLKKKPGAIGIIEDKDIPAVIKTKISPHQIGLNDLLSVMRLLEKEPESITVIGIQPGSIQTGTELSAQVRQNLDDLISVIIDKLRQWGVEVKDVSRRSI
ncbi:MAG: HyaD/HybD family hydrogenase maturation endopeptidase [Thermodesulfovibrionales bacterium]